MSASFIEPLHFLLQENLIDVLRSEVEFGRTWLAPDQRQFDSVLNHARLSRDRSLQTRLGKAAPKNLGGHVPEFTTFVNGPQFHLTHEVFGQIQRRLHASNFPAFQLSGKGKQAKEEILTGGASKKLSGSKSVSECLSELLLPEILSGRKKRPESVCPL